MSMKVTMENMKICKLCDENKPHYSGATTKDGLRNPCKDCLREIDRPKYKYRGMMKIGYNKFPRLEQLIAERKASKA